VAGDLPSASGALLRPVPDVPAEPARLRPRERGRARVLPPGVPVHPRGPARPCRLYLRDGGAGRRVRAARRGGSADRADPDHPAPRGPQAAPRGRGTARGVSGLRQGGEAIPPPARDCGRGAGAPAEDAVPGAAHGARRVAGRRGACRAVGARRGRALRRGPGRAAAHGRADPVQRPGAHALRPRDLPHARLGHLHGGPHGGRAHRAILEACGLQPPGAPVEVQEVVA